MQPTTATGIVVGALIGLISGGYALLTRRRRVKAAWRALSVELEQVREKADAMMGEKVIMAPLWRVPTAAFDNHFATVLEDGRLAEADIALLTTHFQEAATLNRGLDLSAELRGEVPLQEQHGRNLLKAARLAGESASYQSARSIIARFTGPAWWERIPV